MYKALPVLAPSTLNYKQRADSVTGTCATTRGGYEVPFRHITFWVTVLSVQGS